MPGVVRGQPRLWLGAEGAAVLAVAVAAYAAGHYSWMMFGVLFLGPDLSFLAYIAGPRAGAWGYNMMHSYALPLALGAALHAVGHPLGVPLIWIAHIAFDRTVGYGLKYESAFGHTHLGELNQKASPAADV